MIRFERYPLSIGTDDQLDGVWIEGDGPEACVGPLDVDQLRWLILTAGPAVLHAVMAEADAGGGGGPPPATPDATEPADRVDPDLFADVADDRADPHSVGCPWCKAPPGAGCTTSAGTPTRPHSPRRQLVA